MGERCQKEGRIRTGRARGAQVSSPKVIDRARKEKNAEPRGPDSPLTLSSFITPATQGDQSCLPCAFGALTLTDYKPSLSRSGSGHRCARCHQGETYEFLRETDPARDL